jgi:hypothetical protein
MPTGGPAKTGTIGATIQGRSNENSTYNNKATSLVLSTIIKSRNGSNDKEASDETTTFRAHPTALRGGFFLSDAEFPVLAKQGWKFRG